MTRDGEAEDGPAEAPFVEADRTGGSAPGTPFWPRLVEHVPAVPGTIKRTYEDFLVDEIPLIQPAGHGDHVFFGIEKAGLSTMRAIADLARALGVPAGSFGAAGMKDARAVTRQTLSIEHVEPERIRALDLPRIRILWTERHPRKLRTGQLAGNRFSIRLRDVPPDRAGDATRILDDLGRRGVPNYFGSQRFGNRGDTALIGRALLAGDHAGAVSMIAGRPGPPDTGAVLEARTLFEEGRWREATQCWPPTYRHLARLSRAMAREKGDARRALYALDKPLVRLFIQAWQSWLFNDLLARRIDSLDEVWTGDLAYKHETSGLFLVEDAARELPRARNLEISATGPLFGPKMREPEGYAAQLEREVLTAAGAQTGDFPAEGPFRVSGSRRAIRFRLNDASVQAGTDDAGDFLEFRFTLPPGAYATEVLREISRDGLRQAGGSRMPQ